MGLDRIGAESFYNFFKLCPQIKEVELKLSIKRDRGRKGGRRPSFAATTTTKDGPSSGGSNHSASGAQLYPRSLFAPPPQRFHLSVACREDPCRA